MTEKKENGNSRTFLTPDGIKQYLGVITDLNHIIVARLLINGISVKEILKLRARDVKYHRNTLALKDPRRKVGIDPVTTQLLVKYMGRERIGAKTTTKIVTFKERNIRTFINEYGKIAGINHPVKPKTLQNTYFAIQLVHHPEMTIEDYHKHLGYSDIEYTRRLYNYFKAELEKKTSQR
jgi:site-specific recombinase XerD